MGDKLRTTLGLEIVESDLTNNLLYLKGSVPGSKNTYVEIREAVKKKSKETINERVKKYLSSVEDMKSSKKVKKEAKNGSDNSKTKEQKNQIKQNPSDKKDQEKPK